MSKRDRGEYENPPARPAEQRVEEFRNEVRALNAQFASYVSRQQRDNADKLWDSGMRDYLKYCAKVSRGTAPYTPHPTPYTRHPYHLAFAPLN